MPVYNIKAVSRLVGLLPVTLRAWERRYGLPSPQRGIQGYRLYSEHDLRILHWLKNQLDTGLNIGRAVEYLNELKETGQDPGTSSAKVDEKPALPSSPTLSAPNSPSLTSLSADLLHHLLKFDETQAAEILRRAFAIYSVDQVLMDIVTPALVRIGEMWHEENLPIATEHFASQFCMQHLMSLLSASAPPFRSGLIIAACAPGETHQIGLLMLVVMLRWRGWNVKYLGPDLKLDRLETALGPIQPTILMFTANRVENALRLKELPTVLQRFPAPRPLVVFGGQAFRALRLPETIPAVYLNATPSETVQEIEELMQQQTDPKRTHKEKSHV
jgi:DNA-binding transcriptional MerR regulator